jgi:hypothetical protein
MPLYLRGPRSPNTVYSYYKKRFALEIRKLIDPLLEFTDEELKTKQIMVDAYKFKLIPNTVYNRLNWGWKFLIDHYDPDGKYKALRSKCVIQVRGSRVYIRGRREEDPITGVMEDFLVEDDDKKGKLTESWQQDLIDFVTDAPEGESLYVNKNISDDKLIWLADYLSPFVGESIAIIRMSQTGFHLAKNRTLAASQKALKS